MAGRSVIWVLRLFNYFGLYITFQQLYWGYEKESDVFFFHIYLTTKKQQPL